MAEKENGFEQGCHLAYIHSVGLRIQTIFNVTEQSEKQLILFLCDYDKCNNVNILLEVQTTVREHYNLSPIHKALGYETRSTEKDKTTGSFQLETNIQLSTTVTTTWAKNAAPRVTHTSTVMSVALIGLISSQF